MNLTLVWREEGKQATVYLGFVGFYFLKHISRRKQHTLLYSRGVQPWTPIYACGESIQLMTAGVSQAQSTFNSLKPRAKPIKMLQSFCTQGSHRLCRATDFSGI